MRIDRLLSQGLPTVSYEFFPPKNVAGFALLYGTIAELYAMKPSYVSVTYGAGGSTRAKTVELTARIQNELKLRAMAHLTCVGHTRDELDGILAQVWESGVRNVLALRGDPPQGQRWFTPTEGGFAHASDLVAHIAGRYDFCVGVAGYPEGHPECLNRMRDLEHLKQKCDAGASFVVTQLFFDNADFFRFRDEARKIGINQPLVAGIMPILSVQQIKRFISTCGAKIPHDLLTRIEAVESSPDAVYQVGVEHAINQCRQLISEGVQGLHFYTLNRSKATVDIVKALSVKPAV